MSFDSDRIQPWPRNRMYWQYKGRPVLLLGGGVEDNLLQMPNLREHLDMLAGVGGNYVRGPLSSPHEGDVRPFARDDSTGRYDLDRLEPQYWTRLGELLDLTLQRDIIVQIEVWDRFDFAREPWRTNPFNPRNNSNYTAAQTGLGEVIDSHPARGENAFFRTVPELENNTRLLQYQQAFVDHLLSATQGRPHVLYCVDSETNESPRWAAYWADYIRARAGQAVEITEMWDDRDILAPAHEATWKDPARYSFCEISPNNHQVGDDHWRSAVEFRRRIETGGNPRPINSVKVYGHDGGKYGDSRQGLQRFWRNLFAGLAGVRFDRPPAGLGLGNAAQAAIRSARILAGAMDVFSCKARNDLLANRGFNEAYCMANFLGEYAVLFTEGSDVSLDTSFAGNATLDIRYLDVEHAAVIQGPKGVRVGAGTRLLVPIQTGIWVAMVKRVV